MLSIRTTLLFYRIRHNLSTFPVPIDYCRSYHLTKNGPVYEAVSGISTFIKNILNVNPNK